MAKEFKVAIITYSVYGHINKLAKHIKVGLDKVEGSKATIFQVPETLPQEGNPSVPLSTYSCIKS